MGSFHAHRSSESILPSMCRFLLRRVGTTGMGCIVEALVDGNSACGVCKLGDGASAAFVLVVTTSCRFLLCWVGIVGVGCAAEALAVNADICVVWVLDDGGSAAFILVVTFAFDLVVDFFFRRMSSAALSFTCIESRTA